MTDQPTRRPTPTTPATLDIGLATDVGRVREANEDAMLVAPCGELVLVAVADGMGGHQAGEVASALAVQSLEQALAQAADLTGVSAAWLVRAVERANRAIWDAAAEDDDKHGMGTTLVCALFGANGHASVANVGDSRAYVVVGGRATLVTVDHTWVNQQVRDGVISEREARYSPYRNVLTRSLGNTPEVAVDLFSVDLLAAGDALVLVSDGVSGYLDERDVAAIVGASKMAQQAAESLVDEAVRRGGADNATAAVVRKR